MCCFNVLALAFVLLVLVNYSQRARAVITCDFDLYVSNTACTGPLVSSLSELGAQEGGSYFSNGTEHLASSYCLLSSGGGGFYGAGSVKFRQSDNNCTGKCCKEDLVGSRARPQKRPGVRSTDSGISVSCVCANF